MSNKTVLSSIQKYLETQKTYCSPVKVILNESLIMDYYSLHFDYLKTPVEIRIYNSQYIEVRTNNQPIEICCDMYTVRKAIDNLQKLRYAYDR